MMIYDLHQIELQDLGLAIILATGGQTNSSSLPDAQVQFFHGDTVKKAFNLKFYFLLLI